MESLFYVGQKIVANKDHSQGMFKKGDEFIVLDIKKYCCKTVLRISDIINKNGGMICSTCKSGFTTNYFYFNQARFSPVQELGDMTYEDAIELVTPKILEII